MQVSDKLVYTKYASRDGSQSFKTTLKLMWSANTWSFMAIDEYKVIIVGYLRIKLPEKTVNGFPVVKNESH